MSTIKPVSKVDIWNRALVRIGESQLESPTDDGKSAQVLRTVYPQVLKEVLEEESFAWNFAQRAKALALVSNDPVTGYGYAYQLPTDYVTVLKLGNPRAHWEIFGSELHTDESQAVLTYVALVDQPSAYPGKFVKALALALAVELATNHFKKSAAYLERLEAAYSKALNEAWVADMRQDNEAQPQMSSFEQARFGVAPGEGSGIYYESIPFLGEGGDW